MLCLKQFTHKFGLDSLNALITEKVQPFVYGIGDFDADFPAVLEELKAAGLDTYVAEYQRQFSEFMANK